jgi:hypothetical protein
LLSVASVNPNFSKSSQIILLKPFEMKKKRMCVMFGQISEMVNGEVKYRHEKFQHEAVCDRQIRQANHGREEKRNRRFDVLLGVKRGRLSIEEGLNLLENV